MESSLIRSSTIFTIQLFKLSHYNAKVNTITPIDKAFTILLFKQLQTNLSQKNEVTLYK